MSHIRRAGGFNGSTNAFGGPHARTAELGRLAGCDAALAPRIRQRVPSGSRESGAPPVAGGHVSCSGEMSHAGSAIFCGDGGQNPKQRC
jgi:hypothetical protein